MFLVFWGYFFSFENKKNVFAIKIPTFGRGSIFLKYLFFLYPYSCAWICLVWFLSVENIGIVFAFKMGGGIVF